MSTQPILKSCSKCKETKDMGRIKRLSRMIKHVTGFHQKVREKIMLTSYRKYGYAEVTLVKEKVFTYKLVHVLVAQSFIPNPENKPEVNHKWGIKTDNRASELDWMTHRENCIHRSTVLKRNNFKGELNSNSKPIQITCPDGTLMVIKGAREAARRIENVTYFGIVRVLRGDTLTHNGYKFKHIY